MEYGTYCYYPGQNVICSVGYDFISDDEITYYTFFMLDNNGELVNIYDDTISVSYNYENEQYRYYYGGSEITEEEYNNYNIWGDSSSLNGYKSEREILLIIGADR